MFDWITTFTCTVAVMSGLTTTILLLASGKRELPALPISIVCGIIFYFVARIMVTPFFTYALLVISVDNSEGKIGGILNARAGIAFV